jgi:L-asparagine transporter-like permease
VPRVFYFFNWFVILLTLISWRRHSKEKQISLLAFGQPVTNWITMILIVFLAVFALFQKEQRLVFMHV